MQKLFVAFLILSGCSAAPKSTPHFEWEACLKDGVFMPCLSQGESARLKEYFIRCEHGKE